MEFISTAPPKEDEDEDDEDGEEEEPENEEEDEEPPTKTRRKSTADIEAEIIAARSLIKAKKLEAKKAAKEEELLKRPAAATSALKRPAAAKAKAAAVAETAADGKSSKAGKKPIRVWTGKGKPPMAKANDGATDYKFSRIYPSKSKKNYRIIVNRTKPSGEQQSSWGGAAPTEDAWKLALKKADDYAAKSK